MPVERRLLTLDDDPTVCGTIDAIARTAGFQARSTTRVNEFYRLASEWAPTHLVLDLVMPEVDGVVVLRRLAEMGTDAEVIVTSGFGARLVEAARKVASEIGLSTPGVLLKPFSPASLRELLDAESTAAEPPSPPSRTRPLLISEQDIAAAIAKRAFIVHYQPKVECSSGALRGFEALVRWQHEGAGLIMPDRFIATAEHSGLIDGITELVAEQALGWFAANFRGADLQISLNLSARTASDRTLADRISRLCERHSIAPRQVVLEVTETSAMSNPTAALELLTRFRIRGFELSIDDFGIGYSSLAQLARLPFSELKVDRSFVRVVYNSAESQKLVAALVGLARNLGLRVAAEGVEDDWTFDFLAKLGCHEAQGYHIARPMPGDEALRWARRRMAGPEGGDGSG